MMKFVLAFFLAICNVAISFNILDYSHYLDYLPYRQESLVAFEDFRTAPYPPLSLRNRKMNIEALGGKPMTVEDVCEINIWPNNWPFGPEDFRPMDYERDDVINTLPQYQFSQSLIESDQMTLLPGLLRIPTRRHFILPKDKIALAEHMRPYFKDDMKVLELFSTYDSILPGGVKPGPTVGVGWWNKEMQANSALDDFIEQDISVDPYLPLADNYFDAVIMPANFQLLQRPKEMFQEINRVLKPGGTAFIGVKLAMWSFLGWKQCRYYGDTNYLEDVLAVCGFMHYAQGFNRPRSFDLTLPEVSLIGKLKDVLFPQRRLDFYAVVQARKRKDSPHGVWGEGGRPTPDPPIVEGLKYAPTYDTDPGTKEVKLGPFY